MKKLIATIAALLALGTAVSRAKDLQAGVLQEEIVCRKIANCLEIRKISRTFAARKNADLYLKY